jgi:23S rRNA-/tRNA-specific pseudouridylate synthase
VTSPESELDVDVLFDEGDVLVVDKPPGLDMDELRRAVVDAWDVEPGFEGPAFMGRLDRPTSGLVVAALARHARDAIEPHWRAGDVVKEYLVIVEGNVKGSEGVIDFPLAARSERLKGSGRIEEARTSWRKLDGNARASLLLARLHTGKTHQIRRHMKAFKHPVVGDERYGKGGHAGGLMLHSFRLSHDGRVPIVPRVLEVPMPERMRSTCKALGLAAAP